MRVEYITVLGRIAWLDAFISARSFSAKSSAPLLTSASRIHPYDTAFGLRPEGKGTS